MGNTDTLSNVALEPEFEAKVAAIKATLDALFMPGDRYEARIPNVDGIPGNTAIGSFDYEHNQEAAEAIAAFDGRATGIYVTLNPVLPDQVKGPWCRIELPISQGTGNDDIACRRWLPLDFDPVRPRGTSSTEEEFYAAVALAETVASYLKSAGFPAPIVADSGNGAHLLYPIDLPNDEASADLVKRVIRKISAQFSTAAVKIDIGVHNAARIWKVYGTMACKGENTSERSHHQSRIFLNPPKPRQIASMELLEQFLEPEPQTPEPPREQPAPANPLRNSAIEDIKARLDLLTIMRKLFGDEIQKEGGSEVRILGNGGLLVNTDKQTWHAFQDDIGGDVIAAFGYKRFGATWDNRNKAMFKDALEDAAREAGINLHDYYPTSQPAHDYQQPAQQPSIVNQIPQNDQNASDNQRHHQFRFMPAHQVQKLEPPHWLVEGLIPEAAYAMLFGKSGIGKSFMALDIALTVAQRHHVLYAAYEAQYRFADDMTAWCNHYQRDCGLLEFLDFTDPNASELLLMNTEVVQDFIYAIQQYNFQPKLIIIDTLAWALGDGDVLSHKDAQFALANCRQIQQRTGAAVMLVHHTTRDGGDFVGAGNWFNSADCVMKLSESNGILTLEHKKPRFAAKMPNRNFQLIKVASREERTSMVVVPVVSAPPAQKPQESLNQNYLHILTKLAETFKANGATHTEIHDATGITKSTLSNNLTKLKELGYITQQGDRYHITPEGDAARLAAEAKPEEPSAQASSQALELNWAVPDSSVRSSVQFTPPKGVNEQTTELNMDGDEDETSDITTPQPRYVRVKFSDADDRWVTISVPPGIQWVTPKNDGDLPLSA